MPQTPSAADGLDNKEEPALPTTEAAVATLGADWMLLDVATLRDALEALELGELTGSELRAEVGVRLVALARHLRDDDRAATKPLLWSALRRAATLLDPEHADVLGEFLREADDADTRQAALQSLQSVFFNRLPDSGMIAPSLLARVTQLYERYLHPDILVDSKMRALAANAAVAVSVLAPNEATAVAERVFAKGGPGVRALVASKWRDMIDQREEAAAGPLRAALAILLP